MFTLVGNLGAEDVGILDAETAASTLMGDSIYTNPMMLGYAWQRGWVPLEFASLMRAIELNGVQVANNKTASEWGRRAAHDPQAFASLLNGGAQVLHFKPRESVATMMARGVEFLTAYQDAAYAATYQAFVERVRKVEATLGKSIVHQAAAFE